MTILEIRDSIVSYIKKYWRFTPIAWENIYFDPAGLSAWIRPTVIMGSSYIGELVIKGAGWRNGVLTISVFTEKNIGERKAYEYAEILESMFGMDIIDGIVFDQPETKNINSDTWFQVNVSVPFSIIIEY